jgi:hypothetical protein
MSMLRSMLIVLVVGIAILGVAQGQAFAAVIGYWDFSGKTAGVDVANVGDAIADSSGHGHGGTVVQGYNPLTTIALNYVAGDPRLGGSALEFPGFGADGTHIELAASSAFQFNATDAFTLEVDVKLPVLGEPQGMYFQGGAGNGHEYWLRDHTAGGKHTDEVLVYDGGSNAGNFPSTSVVNDNAWHHFAMVYDGAAGGGTLKLYEDGVLNAQQTAIGLTGIIGDSTAAINIGQSAAATNIMDGDIAAIRLSSGALTPSQFFITVPEPSAIVLLGCGLISLLAYAWRRRK